jgi:hypothetical protein
LYRLFSRLYLASSVKRIANEGIYFIETMF